MPPSINKFLLRSKRLYVRSTSDPHFKNSNSKIELNIGLKRCFANRAGAKSFEADHKTLSDLVSKIWESEVQRANRLSPVKRPERSESAAWSERSGEVYFCARYHLIIIDLKYAS